MFRFYCFDDLVFELEFYFFESLIFLLFMSRYFICFFGLVRGRFWKLSLLKILGIVNFEIEVWERVDSFFII